MQVSYDPRYNVAYIRFREKGVEVETLKISDELNIDLAPDGTLYGIELLNANEQLGPGDARKLLVINEASGAQSEVALG